ncbi:MAG: penicillin-insensitive murein endopeptidase [Beijerinckiaceae bacterium]
MTLPARLPLVLATCLIALPAFGQQTQTEEMERRARVIERAPANAAKVLFGTVKNGAPLQARAIGSFARGCVAGATALPVDGQTWQVMRLSRNRNWAHPDLVSLIERISRQAPSVGWNGLLVGDMSQPRGGPMLTGHASHQIGLDADIWLTPMPNRRLSRDERETMSATNMVRSDWMDVDESVYSQRQMNIVRLTAKQPEVTRIFVNPAIKKAMCRDAGSDRAWLSKVRPMWGHNYHFHIRIACTDDACRDQDPPPGGDGCGQELTDWLATQYKAMHAPKRGGGKPKPERWWTLDDLPAECKQVLVAK